jgi:hypothetical protein
MANYYPLHNRKRKRPADTTLIAPIKPGQKVKVYNERFEPRYGEVVGLRQHDQTLLLLERPSFKDLKVSEFNHFREHTEVHFIQDDEDVKRWMPLIVQRNVVNTQRFTSFEEYLQWKEANHG